jgi:hypothetical protein
VVDHITRWLRDEEAADTAESSYMGVLGIVLTLWLAGENYQYSL